MKKLVDLVMLDRLDQLIRLQATGTPEELAARLGISLSGLNENISFMRKALGAPIRYNIYVRSYFYKYIPEYHFGFEKDRTPSIIQIFGGKNNDTAS